MPHVPVAERRAQLLDAAWSVMTEHGFAAATTRAICARAGVAQGAFHYCFDSRDELLREIAVRLLPEQVAAATVAARARSAAPAILAERPVAAGRSLAGDETHRRTALAAAIGGALGAYWDQVEADVAAHQVLYEVALDALRRNGSRDVAEVQYERFMAGARTVLDDVTGAWSISWSRPLDVLARQVVTIVDGLTLHYLVDRDSDAARAALAAFAADIAGAAASFVAPQGVAVLSHDPKEPVDE